MDINNNQRTSPRKEAGKKERKTKIALSIKAAELAEEVSDFQYSLA